MISGSFENSLTPDSDMDLVRRELRRSAGVAAASEAGSPDATADELLTPGHENSRRFLAHLRPAMRLHRVNRLETVAGLLQNLLEVGSLRTHVVRSGADHNDEEHLASVGHRDLRGQNIGRMSVDVRLVEIRPPRVGSGRRGHVVPRERDSGAENVPSSEEHPSELQS